MTIKKLQKDKFLIFEITTDSLTAKDASELKSEFVLECSKEQNLIIDLKHVHYIDSAGLSCMLIADRLTKQNDKISVLCNINERIDKLITLTKLNTILTLLNTIEEAKDFVMLDALEKEF